MPKTKSNIQIYSTILAAFFLFSTAFSQSVLLFFLKNGQISSIDSAVRENIILDNRREVIALLNQATRFGFDRIELRKSGYEGYVEVGNQKSLWWMVKIKRTLYFDTSQSFPSGDLTFYYSPFEGLFVMLSIWISMSLVAIPFLSRYLQKKEKIQKQEEIAKKNKAILEIMNNLAHDMRAPLGIFERLLSTDDESLPRMRGAVKDSLSRLHSMIESLRHSEIETLVKKSLSHIDFRFGKDNLLEKAQKYRILLSIPEADFFQVWIDPMKVERAWINLASNGIEAAKSFVRVEAEKVDTSLFIRVIDDGPGVPDDILPKLFQRGMTSGKAGGTGLGLAYVRQVMQGHGGDVTYRRENGLTIFECYLPHAVDRKEAKTLDEEQPQVIEKEVKTKQVSVCFTPASYGESLISLLVNFQNPRFKFTNSYMPDSEVVVTNDEELSMRSLDEGKETIAINKVLTPEELASRLAYRLNIKR